MTKFVQNMTKIRMKFDQEKYSNTYFVFSKNKCLISYK